MVLRTAWLKTICNGLQIESPHIFSVRKFISWPCTFFKSTICIISLISLTENVTIDKRLSVIYLKLGVCPTDNLSSIIFSPSL